MRKRFWTPIETFGASSGDANVALQLAGFPVYHPKYRAPRQLGVRRVLSLFPGYTFALVTRVNWRDLYSVDGVKRVFLSSDNFVSVVADEFIDLLQSHEDALGYVDVDRLVYHRETIEALIPGQVVRGLYGLFGGQTGRFEGYDEDGYARVLFDILGGRELEAHVDAHELVGA